MIHLLVVTFTSQGHINPFLRFAKRLASSGLHVTFSSTTEVAHRLRAASGVPPPDDFFPVGAGFLRFEFFHDGWETDDPRRRALEQYMPQLELAGTKELAMLLRRQADQSRPVACVVSNPFIPWALDVAEGMGIPASMLWVQSCSVFSAYYHYHHRLIDFPSEEHPDLSVSLPGLPTPLRTHEVPSFLLPNTVYPSVTTAILGQFRNLGKARWLFANSFEELEKDVIEGLALLVKLVPVGPLVEGPMEEELTAANGRGTSGQQIKADLIDAEDECAPWLDAQGTGTVVYVSVGSVVRMCAEEMAEMAWGLRLANRPFIWVVRDESRELLPEGFEAEITEHHQGLVVKWASQDRVLSHPALACFVTHCGWNSTLESLAAGIRVVAFPHWGDQPTDAKLLVEVCGVGTLLRPSPPPPPPAPSFARSDVVRAVYEVTDGPRVEEMRDNSTKWKEAARTALEDGGSSHRNIQGFVADIRAIVGGAV